LIAVEGGSLFRFRAWLRLVSVTLGEEGKESAIVSFHIVIEQLDQHLAKLGIRMRGAMFEREGTSDYFTAGVEPAILPLLDSFKSGDPVLQLSASLLQFIDTLRARFSRHERMVFIGACESNRPYIILNPRRQNPKSSQAFFLLYPLSSPPNPARV
jgi:hypothetical protein